MRRRRGAARRWKAFPRPRPRRLPPWLLPSAVYRRAGRLPGGLAQREFRHLVRSLISGPIVGDNRLRLFFHGEEALQAMLDSIEGARREVLVESYIFRDDATGRRFRDALAAAASRGVEVKVLADGVGSFETRRGFWEEMRRAGIDARLYHPLTSGLWVSFYRDHRKICIVDRRVAFTGGMNIGDEWGSRLWRSRQRGWRDTHAGLEGPAVWELLISFSESWEQAGAPPLAIEPLAAPADRPQRVAILDSSPARGAMETASVLAAIAGGARRRLWITNSYFAPGRRARRYLRRAARRGIDVRILLAGPTDVPIVRHAGHAYYRELLEAGARIFEFEPTVLHAKTLVADEDVCVVGSSNLDFRSFHFNAECNVLVFDRDASREVAEAFEEDLSHSREIALDAWARRSWLHRAGDGAVALLSPLL